MSKRRFPTRILSRNRVCCDRRGPNYPLTEYDLLNSPHYIPNLWVYREDLDLEIVRDTLRRALALMPVFAGTLIEEDGDYSILCDDRGAELVVQECSSPLPKDLAETGGRMARELVIVGNPLGIARRQAPLLIVTFTRMAGGGTTLGISSTHWVSDGGGLSIFLSLWSKIAQTGIAPSPPTLDRGDLRSLAASYDGSERGGATAFTDHGTMNYFLRGGRVMFHGHRTQRRVLRYSAEDMERCRTYAAECSDDRLRLSRYDVLTAHLWRELAGARGGERGSSKLSFLLDLRSRRELGLAWDYTGNAFISREMDGEEKWLRRSSLGRVARRYREQALQPIGREAVGKDLAWLREARRRGRRMLMKFPFVPFEGGLMINNLTRAGEPDFGTGRPAWLESVNPVARMAMLLQTPERDGGCLAVLQTPKGEAWRVRRFPLGL